MAETLAGVLQIGLAHGSDQGILAEEIDSPNPIAIERAEQKRHEMAREALHLPSGYLNSPDA